MLMKTSASDYAHYRVWTLAAAKNVYSSSCYAWQSVKLAWDAVHVPHPLDQYDPFCGVSADNPGPQTSVIGVPAALTLTAHDALPPFTWQVTGLPPGLTSTADGQITGTATATGTFTVFAGVFTNGFFYSSATFNWTVLTIVPDIRGLDRVGASNLLASAGLLLGNENDKVQHNCSNVGIVLAQSPGVGTPVPQGSSVNFDFGVAPSGTNNCQ